MFNFINKEIHTYDYNLSLSVSGESYSMKKEDKFVNTTNLNGVDDYAIYKYDYLDLKNPKYKEEYISLNEFDKDYINKDDVIEVLSIGDYQYRKYLEKLGLNYDEYQNKAILVSNKIKWKNMMKSQKRIKLFM